MKMNRLSRWTIFRAILVFYFLCIIIPSSPAQNHLPVIDSTKNALEREKLKKEIALLDQSLATRPSGSVPLVVSVIGGILGIVTGVVSGIVAARRQAKFELDKWTRERSAVFETEFRNTVKELTIDLASALHSILWLCWLARFGSEKLTKKHIDNYDKEMHKLLPRIEGKYSIIAGMDFNAFNKIRPLITAVLSLDGRVGGASLLFNEGDLGTAQALANLYDESAELEQSIPNTVSQAIKQYSV